MKITNAYTPQHEFQMKQLGEFCGASEVAYTDTDKGEIYLLTKEGKTLELRIRSNKVDGGYLVVVPGVAKS